MNTLGDVPILSVKQPWASLIAHGHKDIENRTWRPRKLGRIAIHASMQWDAKGAARVLALRPDLEDLLTRSREVKGRIVGTVEVTEVVDDTTARGREWFSPGGYGWVLSEATRIESEPIKGRLMLWRAPDLQVKAVKGAR